MSSLEDAESLTLSGTDSSDPSSSSAAPSSTVSLSNQTPTPTSPVLAPSPTDDDLDDYQTFPPMTTPWTVPISCTWTYDAERVPEPGATGPVAWLDLEPIPGAKSLSCYPDGMFTDGRTGVFSPATCPHGWTTAELRVDTDEAHDDATTTAVCCSSAYSLDGNLCKRLVPTVVAVPISYNHTARSYDVLSDSTTTLYSATIAVYTIRALFKDGDKDALGLKDEDDIGPHRPAKTLSLAARIGIGVGVAVFVLFVIGAIAYFLVRRDRVRSEKKRAHELDVMRARHGTGGLGDDFYAAANGHHRRDRNRHGEPPPAYEAATDSTSVTDNDSRLSDDLTTRDEELRALQVQKAAIQRRIEELERSESNQDQNQNQNQDQNRQH
ncbi:hypothetical protein NCS57_00109600 [Fusarium keratoplasticum]|uniref:Uncharacterized protein n=1 Tax=Fusarium keratoplasticum TaxID=1328300 RepID=A0ACC0RFY4_9HYPO|nr:hypothetical protein NCS57_00109600 [Fusarium keratoplasticum]KAI8684435.1 hypothetical protein NCS57_00109600 [Fusarium keratoplasticum]KAI8688548.1 hypothetical protein NCS55_00108700 [Fusarium keratoplasticum]